MEFYTTREAAEILKLTPETVSRYCLSGALPGAFRLTPTSRWRIPKSTFERLYQEEKEISEMLLPPRSPRSQALRDAAARRRRRAEWGLP